ncbi:site-specific DNA-methyltransferase [Priestia sp. SB1]|uniref:DNA-methyltransferase n=1 Tax=Priestia sp. SB1 TaxID=3132359 RepID=UPI00317ADF18
MKELLGELELNRIYQRDCLADDGMKLIPDKSIDMILCDLPYGTTRCKWDEIIPFDPLWKQYERVIKDNGAIVLTASQPFTSALIMSNPKLFKYCWYWDKVRGVGHLNAKRQPLKSVEDICVFYKKQCTYNPQMREREKPRKSSNKSTQQVYGKSQDVFVGETLDKRYPVTLLTYSKSDQKDFRLHPTQKPVELFEYLINTYTNEGDTVLDNCMGSGTTAVAATNLNRKWIGFETESEYIEVTNKRLEQIELHTDLSKL